MEKPTGGNSDGRYAVVIGNSNMDIAGTRVPGVAMRAFDAGPGVIRYKRGGVARNVAENLARLGCDCRFVSVFGDDHHGQALWAATSEAGVDLSPSRIVPDATTSTCLVVNDSAGEMFYAIADLSIIERLSPAHLADHSELLEGAALIVTNTDLSEEALDWLFTRHGDRPLLVDTVDAFYAGRILPWLSRVHTIKPNRAEASQLSGLPFKSREHAPPIADWFHRAGVMQVVLSLGEYGLYYSNGQSAGWMEPLPVDVVNVSGAGDALLAGLAYGWLEGQPFVDALRFACGCAALTLTTEDNNYPALSPSAVRELLRRARAPLAPSIAPPAPR
ncbi:PfkB family carbohydrate kinase [Paludibacterium yongneupense]|uniref:PfkB family carbohydrate kinase n=1 Tax=Paludibacterium yongneupense TaxID=400061 RepID=UPI00041FCBCF|nr:PfkB family carbohydrate kinase [Paludibacterium yongneupense]